MEGGIIVDIVKVGVTTFIISRMSKTIGQKEIGEIVSCVGVLACGVMIIKGFIPLVEGIQEFNNNIGNLIEGISNVVDKIMLWR